MTVETQESPKDSRGVHAYRWIVLLTLGVLGTLSVRVLNQIDKTGDKIEVVQAQVLELKGTLEAVKGTYDSRIAAHEQRINAVELRARAQDTRIEEMMKQMWQRK